MFQHSGFYIFSDSEKNRLDNLESFKKCVQVQHCFYATPLLARPCTLRNSISRTLLFNQLNLLCQKKLIWQSVSMGIKLQYSYVLVDARNVFVLYFLLWVADWFYFLSADGEDKSKVLKRTFRRLIFYI